MSIKDKFSQILNIHLNCIVDVFLGRTQGSIFKIMKEGIFYQNIGYIGIKMGNMIRKELNHNDVP